MKTRQLILGIFLSSLTTISLACESAADISLHKAREKVISRYLSGLKKRNAKEIISLFDSKGVVISTSKGQMAANDFFTQFIPQVESANTKLHQTFVGSQDKNRLSARFQLSLTMKNGQQSDSEYVDEFIFEGKSTQLAAVYMFENNQFSIQESA